MRIETSLGWNEVEVAKTGIAQKQDEIRIVRNMRLTIRVPQTLCEMMTITISDTWPILDVLMMRRIGMMMVMKKQSWAWWGKMTNPAGWWAQYPKRYSSTRYGFGGGMWSLRKWHSQDGGTWLITTGKELGSMLQPNWRYSWSLMHNWIQLHLRLLWLHLES